jgi:probable F420-dependent oxidoreductase
VKVGIFFIHTDRTITAARLAAEIEARGFDSLFLPEHTHIPVSRRTPRPSGGELPGYYKRMVDPFVGLATAVPGTERLTLGTAVCLVAQHDTLTLAKTVASLDHLSGGRLLLGVGYGWNTEEAADHGIDPRTRRRRLREQVAAMRCLWSEEEAGFEGEFVTFEPSWMWPKPIQQPGPPVYVGGVGTPRLFGEIVTWADGWMPLGQAELADKLKLLRSMAEEAGRDPASIGVTLMEASDDPSGFERCAELGVERGVLALPPFDTDRALETLDRYAATLDKLGLL